MKFLSLALMLVAPAAAMACPHSREQFVCPGDLIVDAKNYQGTVLAVNPFNHTISYSSDDFNGNRTAPMTSLGLAQGCLEAFCVGDSIVDANNYVGTVIGVNPFNNMVSYSSADFNGNRSASVRSLKVAYGCALGYCVGDRIVDANNYAGVIIALSPYSDSAAYSSDDFNGNRSAAIESLSNSGYCEQYGDSHPARLAQHYPQLPSSRYAAPDFRYYSKR